MVMSEFNGQIDKAAKSGTHETRVGYTRLPGRSPKYFGVPFALELFFTFGLLAVAERSRLYAGNGAVVVVRRWFFRLTARRLYFDEIQAVIAHRTPAGGYASLVLALLMAITTAFLALHLANPGGAGPQTRPPEDASAAYRLAPPRPAPDTFGGGGVFAQAETPDESAGGTDPAGPGAIPGFSSPLRGLDLRMPATFLMLLMIAGFGVALVVNVARGPTCTFEIHTPVTCERVPCVGRWRTAQQVLGALEREATAVQGTLGEPAELHLGENRVPRGQAPPAPRAENGRLHLLFFGLCLVLAAGSAMDYFMYSPAKNALGALLLLGTLTAGALALARQQHSNLPSGIRAIAGALVVLIVAFFSLGSFAIGASSGFMAMNSIFESNAAPLHMVSPYEIPSALRRLLAILEATAFGPLALAGCAATWRFRRTQQYGAASRTPPQAANAFPEDNPFIE